PKARANGPKGPKTKAQSSAHGDQTSNHFEIDICSGLFSIALTDHPEWNAVFLDVVREHTAGNPQHGIIWTDLKPREIAQAMT
ncbi:hypothetical protein V4C53_47910, partial [Paraburkholderia azotifigens]|uniref:hypothetical protein n=1 Tax=Paraburkholderia azotifigens TaxID=2057004 RepID=UPI003179496A